MTEKHVLYCSSLNPERRPLSPFRIQGMNRYMYVEGNPVKYNDPSGHSQERGWLGGLIHDLNIWNKNMQNDWHPWAKNLQKDYHKWNKKLLGNLSSWTTDLIHDNNRAFKKYLLHKTDYEVSPFGRSDLGRSGLGKSDLLQFFVKPLDRWNPGGDIGRSVGHWFYDKVSKPFWGDLSYDFFHYPWRAFRKSDIGRSDIGIPILRNQACVELAYYAYSIFSGYDALANDNPGKLTTWLGQKAGLNWTEILSLSQDMAVLTMPSNVYNFYKASQRCHARSL